MKASRTRIMAGTTYNIFSKCEIKNTITILSLKPERMNEYGLQNGHRFNVW